MNAPPLSGPQTASMLYRASRSAKLLGQRTHELRPQEHRLQIEPQIAVVAGFETEVAATRGQKLRKLGWDVGIGLRDRVLRTQVTYGLRPAI